MKQIRCLRSVAREIKAEDPNTAITEWLLRDLVLKGDIPAKKIGSRYYLDKEDVIAFFTATGVD